MISNNEKVLNDQLTNNLLAICFYFLMTSVVLSTFVWPNSTSTLQIAFEIICSMITICIFSVIWIAADFKDLSPMYRIIGYGLLSVTVMSLFHIIAFINGVKDGGLSLYEIHTPYWLSSRIVEVIVILYAAVEDRPNKRHSKVLALLETIGLTIALMLLLYFAENHLPSSTKLLYKMNINIVFLFTIFMYIITWQVRTKNEEYDLSKDRLITVAIFCFIGAAICPLLLNINVRFDFLFTLGYLFKLGAYFALLQGVYTEAIINPYRALDRSKEHLNKTLNILPLGVMGFKMSTGINYANHYLLDLLECTFHDLHQMTVDEFNTAFDVEPLPNRYELFTLKTLKGNQIVIQLKKLENEHGILITFTDTRAEQKLDTLHLQTEMIFNSVASQIMLLDENHTILYANKKNEECVELKADSIIGLSVFEYSKMLDLKYNDDDYIKYENIREENTHYTLTTPSGKEKTIMAQYKKIKDEYGNIIGYVSIANDITDMVQEQEKIQQQERLALIGQMGNGIVHETKNYLASIKGYCDLLSISLEDDTMKNYVLKIETIANDMNGLVSKYLELSRPSQAILDILSLNEIISSILYIIKSPSFLGDTRLELDLCKNDMEILADDNLIKHVIINLTKNAVEAMENTKNPLLIIATRVKGHFMQIVVKDNGCGISKENIKILGTPFFTTKQSGTGLGLSNCFKIINEIGGQINVESKLREGTTFYIELPIFQDNLLGGDDQKKDYSTIA